MKIFLKLISLLIIVAVLYLATSNLAQVLNLALYNGVIHVKFVYIFIGVLFAGVLAGLAWIGADYLSVNAKLKEYQRKLEKTSVNAECDNSKVSVLEAKIEVLEKALKSALEKNND